MGIQVYYPAPDCDSCTHYLYVLSSPVLALARLSIFHEHPYSRPTSCLQGLSKLIADNAPTAVKVQKFENYFGRKIAIDASMSLYQFLVRPHCPCAAPITACHKTCCSSGLLFECRSLLGAKEIRCCPMKQVKSQGVILCLVSVVTNTLTGVAEREWLAMQSYSRDVLSYISHDTSWHEASLCL